MTDTDSHTIALEPTQPYAQKNVANIRQTVVETKHEHRHSGKSRNGKRIFNRQRIETPAGVLHIGRERAHSFACVQLRIHRKDHNASARVRTEAN